ncbi:MAG: hypothetical protein ACLFWB_02235 [Armatimonadota bacterium]
MSSALLTLGALGYQAYGFFTSQAPNYVLGAICALLIVLAVYVSAQAVPRLRKAIVTDTEVEADEEKTATGDTP